MLPIIIFTYSFLILIGIYFGNVKVRIRRIKSRTPCLMRKHLNASLIAMLITFLHRLPACKTILTEAMCEKSSKGM